MTGEEKHETCRYGVFAQQAFRVDERGRETAFAMPLCAWSLGPCLTRLTKMWGGQINGVEDCAECPAYDPL